MGFEEEAKVKAEAEEASDLVVVESLAKYVADFIRLNKVKNAHMSATLSDGRTARVSVSEGFRRFPFMWGNRFASMKGKEEVL